MTSRIFLLFAIVLLVLFTSALQTPAADRDSFQERATNEEMSKRYVPQPPQTLEQKLLEAIEGVDNTVVVSSADGRTVLAMEGEPGDEFTLSFSNAVDGVRAHVQLGKGGLKHRFILIKPEGHDDSPIYLDIQGPAINGGYGVKVVLRF